MKKIEKKWMLFLMATFITVFGISYTLVKKTIAANVLVPNENINLNYLNGDVDG